MPDAPVRVPDTFDELQERLRNAWTKGKAAGASNTSLMNTSKMFVELFMQKESQKITPYQQAVLNMQKEQFDYNKKKDERGEFMVMKNADGSERIVRVKPDGTVEEVNSEATGNDFIDPNSDSTASDQPMPDGMGPSGLTAEDQQAIIDSLGQGDQFGVLGITDPTTLEKGPGYMQSEEEKKRMFAEQEAKQKAEEEKEKSLKESGVVGTYSQPVSEAIAKASQLTTPAGIGSAVGNFFEKNVLPKASELFFGQGKGSW